MCEEIAYILQSILKPTEFWFSPYSWIKSFHRLSLETSSGEHRSELSHLMVVTEKAATPLNSAPLVGHVVYTEISFSKKSFMLHFFLEVAVVRGH